MLARLKHFFLPRESNNFRAKIIQHQTLSFFSVVFLAFQLLLSSVLLVKPQVLGFASQISPEKVIELTNKERAKVGVLPLKINNLLNESAQRKAGDMFAFNYWAHNSPSGRDPWSFFKEVGYRYLYAGENLARDFSSPEAAVAAWMASSTHRENILNPKYQEMGIAVVDGTLGGVETTLVVQLFGTPVSPLPQTSKEVVVPPEVNEVSAERTILSQATGKERILTNPFQLTQGLGISLLGIITAVIILDGIIVHRKKAYRLSGRSLAHVLFLSGVIFVILLSTQGAIL